MSSYKAKMTYLQQSNHARSRARKKAYFVAFLVIAVLVLFWFFPGGFYRLAHAVFSPFWKAEDAATDKTLGAFEILRSKVALVAENEGLKRELASVKPSLLSLSELEIENASLREALGRKAPGEKRILASILKRPPHSPYDTLIIDIGTDQGVAVGDRVFGPGNLLLGDIAEVYPESAKALLFSAPGREVAVALGSRAGELTALGKGGGNFSLSVPVEIGVSEGDVVRAPGFGGVILGVAEHIEVDSSDSLQEVLFKLPTNISEISFVEVELNR